MSFFWDQMRYVLSAKVTSHGPIGLTAATQQKGPDRRMLNIVSVIPLVHPGIHIECDGLENK